jgi:hypothetical protein
LSRYHGQARLQGAAALLVCHASDAGALINHSGCALHTLSMRCRAAAAHALLAMQCFNHFSLYLKGREELVVTVYHGAMSRYTPPPMARITISGCGPRPCACLLCVLQQQQQQQQQQQRRRRRRRREQARAHRMVQPCLTLASMRTLPACCTGWAGSPRACRPPAQQRTSRM